ncbi:MAG: mechanosensitive ion channel family protein, partial [Pseudomonadota bacterium]|nr:mechanosensitive ion channel family protein [Pseudomonadota bacterium]
MQQRLFGSALQLLFLLSLVAVLLTGAPMAGAQEVRAQEPGAAPTSTEERAGSLDQNRVARAREYLRDNP